MYGQWRDEQGDLGDWVGEAGGCGSWEGGMGWHPQEGVLDKVALKAYDSWRV